MESNNTDITSGCLTPPTWRASKRARGYGTEKPRTEIRCFRIDCRAGQEEPPNKTFNPKLTFLEMQMVGNLLNKTRDDVHSAFEVISQADV